MPRLTANVVNELEIEKFMQRAAVLFHHSFVSGGKAFESIEIRISTQIKQS